MQGGLQKSSRFSQVITSLSIELGIRNRSHWKMYTLKFVYDTLIFFKTSSAVAYKSRADLQSSWLDAEEHRESWTLWFQPPSDLDIWYSMILTRILFVSRAPKGKSPVETGLVEVFNYVFKVVEVTTSISPDVLQRVIKNFEDQLSICIAAAGETLEK